MTVCGDTGISQTIVGAGPALKPLLPGVKDGLWGYRSISNNFTSGRNYCLWSGNTQTVLLFFFVVFFFAKVPQATPGAEMIVCRVPAGCSFLWIFFSHGQSRVTVEI